jgi:hypothetical protein
MALVAATTTLTPSSGSVHTSGVTDSTGPATASPRLANDLGCPGFPDGVCSFGPYTPAPPAAPVCHRFGRPVGHHWRTRCYTPQVRVN